MLLFEVSSSLRLTRAFRVDMRVFVYNLPNNGVRQVKQVGYSQAYSHSGSWKNRYLVCWLGIVHTVMEHKRTHCYPNRGVS